MPKAKLQVGDRALTLDARPDRLDLRDLPYRPPVGELPHQYPSEENIQRFLPGYVEKNYVLDQGEEGACTGFGLAAVVNYLLWTRREAHEREMVSPHMFYHLARFYDEWPGEDYEGSSCRGALKGWHKHGVCTDAYWGLPITAKHRPKDDWDLDAVRRPLGVYYRVDKESVTDMQAAINNSGAIYCAAQVHDGWDLTGKKLTVSKQHNDLPDIKIPKGKYSKAGHAFALVGYNTRGFIVQNSWGALWGAGGFAVMTYEDWIDNGDDAWVVGLGVPQDRAAASNGEASAPLRSPRHYVHTAKPQFQTAGRPGWLGGDDPLKGRKDAWSKDQAYAHTLVTGNDGRIINHLPDAADAAHSAQRIVYENPLKFFKDNPDAPQRIGIYVHGGLNSEDAAITRVRMMAPGFADNDVYPIFIAWKSGPLEVIGNMVADAVKENFGGGPAGSLLEKLTDATDRMVEVLCRNLLVRAMWQEMKENVARAEQGAHGLAVLVTHLAQLNKDLGGALEVHFGAHSAGSFATGRLLKQLGAQGMRAASCTLFAPACSVAFANEHYATAMQGNKPFLPRDKFFIYALSDKRERDDSVALVYRKSLLYLVSRALEDVHKTPLLGMATAFDAQRNTEEFWHADAITSLKQWQQAFWQGFTPPKDGFAEDGDGHVGGELYLLNKRSVDMGSRATRASHGCFDNSIDIVNATIEHIIGKKPKKPVKDLDY